VAQGLLGHPDTVSVWETAMRDSQGERGSDMDYMRSLGSRDLQQ
jgi:hypothetical protein